MLNTALQTLLQQLADTPHRLGFLQALRRVQQATPELPRIGCSARPADDALRLGQPPTLVFAPGTVHSFTQAEGQPTRLSVHALGLFGPHGPLPGHLTEHAFERLHHHGDGALAAFADVFHHRLLSLFFRAWAQAQPTVDMDRPHDSHYSAQLGALIGLDAAALQAPDALPNEAKLHHAGAAVGAVRNVEGLLALVREQWGLPAVVDEFVGAWMPLQPQDQMRLGGTGAGCQLGQHTLLGRRCYSAQHKFRLRLGPLGWRDYQHFLPGQPGLARLQAAVRHLLGEELDWELALQLRQAEVPALKLASTQTQQQAQPQPAGLGLGHASWLGQPRHDPADLRLQPAAVY